MNTITLGDLWGTFKRRIVFILLITVFCAGLVVAQSLLKSEKVLATSYTAEATLYLSGAGSSEDTLAYNYELDESRELENARRIVISDSVAGEVKRHFNEQDPGLTITSPFPYDSYKADRVMTNFIYIDATSADPQVAIDAADRAAQLAVEKIADTIIKVEKVVIYEQAIIKSGDNSFAANPGIESTGESALDSGETPSMSGLAKIDKKNLAIAFFVGLFGSAFAFCVYEILNRKIRTAHDAEVMIGIPVIATLPITDIFDQTASSTVTQLVNDIQVLLPADAHKVVSVVSIANPDVSAKMTQALFASFQRAKLPISIIKAAEPAVVNLESMQKAVGSTENDDGFVLIDSGALANDAQATLGVAAGTAVLLVTRQQEARSAQIKKALRQLQIADKPLLGIALLVKKGSQLR